MGYGSIAQIDVTPAWNTSAKPAALAAARAQSKGGDGLFPVVTPEPTSSSTRALGARTPSVAATMATMLLFTRHPDAKLGLLLVVAALLLDMGTSGASWAWLVSDHLNSTVMGVGWLGLMVGLGSFCVVLAAIWVDRRPLHGMMAAGAGILALGLVLVTLSRNFGTAAAGLFLVGAGGSAFHPLVFYAIAVKGCARFSGTLIGILSLVFEANLGAGAVRDWEFDIPAGWLALMLTLTGGIALYILLPRWFRATYDSGSSLRETIAVPGVRAGFVSAAAVHLVAAMAFASSSLHLRWVTAATASPGTAHDAEYQALALAGGIGALAWGAASDFLPVRWLLIALAALSLPAAAWVWLSDDPGAGAHLLLLVRGGLISLPWVLMADLLPKRHFAKFALVIILLGTLGGSLGLFYLGTAFSVLGAGWFVWIALIESCVLAAVVAWRPTDRGGWPLDTLMKQAATVRRPGPQ